MAKKLILILYIALYIFLASFSLAVFRYFKPFTYIENNTSYVICDSGQKFQIGPNSIFAFNRTLDSYNDIKVRKLCQYQIIRDDINMYKTPDKINYRFSSIEVQQSSWINAVLALCLAFSVGSIIIELVMKLLSYKISYFSIGRFIFDLFSDLIT